MECLLYDTASMSLHLMVHFGDVNPVNLDAPSLSLQGSETM